MILFTQPEKKEKKARKFVMICDQPVRYGTFIKNEHHGFKS